MRATANRKSIVPRVLAAGCVLAAACAGGCDGGMTSGWPSSAPTAAKGKVSVPEPINLLLPTAIRIHPLTGTRVFSEQGGIQGIDVRIEALDAYEEKTKAFGAFRFELYQYKPNSADPRGSRIAAWVQDISKPEDNALLWEKYHRMYLFKLGWLEPIPIGERFVIETIFQSPFTPRLFDRHVFISGE